MATHVNIGLTIERLLVDVYEFVPMADRDEGWWIREMDTQHSLIINLNGWRNGDRRGYERGGTILGVVFGVARRDINEVWHNAFNPRVPVDRPTVSGASFFGEGNGLNGIEHTVAEVEEWVNEWLPRFIEEAPSLSFVESKILPADPPPIRMVQALIAGWTDADEEEFIGPWLADIERLPPEHDHHEARKKQLAMVRAWLAEHPDGLGERELTD